MADAAQASLMSADVMVTVACGFAVALYAAKRYNTPDTNRLTTTRTLFLATGAGYVIASLAIFVVLSQIVLKPGVLSFLGVDHVQEVVAKYAAPAVLAALLLTTLFPNVAVVSMVDAFLLKAFQGWGRIPQGVRSLADELALKALVVRQDDLKPLREWIDIHGDVPSELAPIVSTDAAETSRGALTRCLLLYQELARLSGEPHYAEAFRAHQSAWDAVQANVRVFAAQSHAFLVLFDHLGPAEGAAVTAALKQARERYGEICAQFHRRMAEFLAQMLLIGEPSEQRVRIKAKSMGFYLDDTSCPPLPIGPFAFTGVMMILAILSVVAVVPAPSRDVPLPVMAVLIATTQTIALLAAVLPKLRWAAFRQDQGNLPYLGWLASAAFAGLLALLLDRAAVAITAHMPAAGLDFTDHRLSAMGPMAFVTSLAIAILCDVNLRLGYGWSRRVMEAMLCGAVRTVAIFVFIHLLDINPATKGQAPHWFPFVFSFSLGFACGLVAPHLYRQARPVLAVRDWQAGRSEAGLVHVEDTRAA